MYTKALWNKFSLMKLVTKFSETQQVRTRPFRKAMANTVCCSGGEKCGIAEISSEDCAALNKRKGKKQQRNKLINKPKSTPSKLIKLLMK
ncbi:CLUMA_CG009692, isoform A [Clunio marinus]|uniref:CLUMA_CG009692, isoform A n=1 Tax=Clunio marinus TaxID=568069 RepID=A0A1J1I7K6_9DIPT|nr:CLUMA_CG009692, isoform A [Clunio marinus]